MQLSSDSIYIKREVNQIDEIFLLYYLNSAAEFSLSYQNQSAFDLDSFNQPKWNNASVLLGIIKEDKNIKVEIGETVFCHTKVLSTVSKDKPIFDCWSPLCRFQYDSVITGDIFCFYYLYK